MREIEKGIYNDVKTWTALKLIGLTYFASIYSKIIPKSSWIGAVYYIDLLAGSGLCKIKETGDIILGSAITTPDSFKNPLTKAFFIEHDINKVNALEERLNYLNKNRVGDFRALNFDAIQGDCNKAIYEVLDEIDKHENRLKKGKRSHFLAFVDPYGMEVKRRTMEALLERSGDIIFTFQSFLLTTRGIGKARKFEADENTMTEFCGGTWWRDVQTQEELLERYLEEIIQPHRDIQLNMSIKGRRQEAYNYDWILATKLTSGGSGWLRGVYNAKQKIEKLTGDDVRRSLDLLKGRTKKISQFKKESQRSLDHFS